MNHKSREFIHEDLVEQFGAGTTTHSRAAWTGHLLENGASSSDPDTHTIVITIGMVTDDENNNKSADIIRKERIYTLLHEASHQLGAPDHYCYDIYSYDCNNPSNDCWRCDRGLAEPPDCLMTSRMGTLEEMLNSGMVQGIYCSQCMSTTHEKGILSHLLNHHS